MKATGVSFAVSFAIFRVILWPYVNYYFWMDMMHMWNNNLFHNKAVACIYLVVNVGLTILQLVWMVEIVQTGLKMFSEEAGTVSVNKTESKKKR